MVNFSQHSHTLTNDFVLHLFSPKSHDSKEIGTTFPITRCNQLTLNFVVQIISVILYFVTYTSASEFCSRHLQLKMKMIAQIALFTVLHNENEVHRNYFHRELTHFLLYCSKLQEQIRFQLPKQSFQTAKRFQFDLCETLRLYIRAIYTLGVYLRIPTFAKPTSPHSYISRQFMDLCRCKSFIAVGSGRGRAKVCTDKFAAAATNLKS